VLYFVTNKDNFNMRRNLFDKKYFYLKKKILFQKENILKLNQENQKIILINKPQNNLNNKM
jgi:hypothetical protein